MLFCAFFRPETIRPKDTTGIVSQHCRDVKPSNMCVGIGEHRRIIYLVDFGEQYWTTVFVP